MADCLFVSYARGDSEKVDEVIASLKWRGFSIWIDRDSIRFGEWSKKIDEAISECRAVIVMVSPRAASSKWVERELAYGAKLGKTIVPILLDKVPLPDVFRKTFGHVQLISYDDGADVCANLVEASLKEFGVVPVLLDETDPDLLEARRLFNSGDHASAFGLYDRIIEARPLHLVAVMSAVTAHYNAGQARVLREENQGVRPRGINEMVPEFRAAERIATQYIDRDTGEYDRFFKAELSTALGMLASFIGMYDDAINRLSTAQEANPENPKISKMLDQLRSELSRDVGSARLPFPEGNQFSTWHAIVFPFGAVVGGGEHREKKRVRGLLPKGRSSEKGKITDAFRSAMSELPSSFESHIRDVWNSQIDHKEYVID